MGKKENVFTKLIEKVSSLELSSFVSAMKRFAWPLIVVFVFVSVVIFFLSYSLARHKRMVFRLTVELQAARTEAKVKDLKIKAQEEQLKLSFLKKGDAQEKVKREEILKNLKKLDEASKKSKASLEKERSKIKKTEDIDSLLEQAKKLTQETL